MKRDLLTLRDLSPEEILYLVSRARELKAALAQGVLAPTCEGKILGLIFVKPSTRTRVSFETAMYRLGGRCLFMTAQDTQISRQEPAADTARVLSRYVSAVMIRAYSHASIEEFAAHSTVPVINGLSDREHPCQLLADIFTIRERFGRTSGLVAAWVGDGNNVCNSLVLSAGMTGMEVRVASPPAYAPDPAIIERGRAEGGRIVAARTPEEAVEGADVIFTDTWVSMGAEGEEEARREAFSGYCIDERLVARAADHAIVMHCLPAHRGEEISDAVLDGPRSAVWDEAENRLHVQKAVLLNLLATFDERTFQQLLE